MRKTGVQGASCTLTVYFDGQFWAGVIERRCEGTLEVARIVFGAEPSDERVYQLVLSEWPRICFDATDGEKDLAPTSPGNPKRRQREAAREASRARPSTAAQEALARAREERRQDGAARRAAAKRKESQDRYQLRREKRRRRHKGR